MKNKLIEKLVELNISSKDSFELYHTRTRDFDSLNVLKCVKSGVIVLEEVLRTENYYENTEKKGLTKTKSGSILPLHLDDDLRRFEDYKNLIKDANILDFGCGKGGFLELSLNTSRCSVGFELNKGHVKKVKKFGVECFSSFDELKSKHKFDLITLNHVLEHLESPCETLSNLSDLLMDSGTMIIEVPHARDFLIETFDINSFKDYTFWSEHLILHTKESLVAFAKESGLKLKRIEGFQRYPISNHFNWLLNGKPGGHEIFSKLNNSDFHYQYQKYLSALNQTDTLIGYFTK